MTEGEFDFDFEEKKEKPVEEKVSDLDDLLGTHSSAQPEPKAT